LLSLNNLYRDDFDLGNRAPVVRESDIPFAIEGRTILLIDEVLFTGRTTVAALQALGDYGRPASVRLVVLVDRGLRELPVEPNFTGVAVTTCVEESIRISFREAGGEDRIERVASPQ
jgi:pyrimidine operon attenuation protein/uracil phosphoribosyltransferase